MMRREEEKGSGKGRKRVRDPFDPRFSLEPGVG